MTDEPTPTDPLTELRERNKGLVEELARNGMGVGGDVVLFVGFDTLLDLLLPQNTPFRHLFDMQREMNMNNILTQHAGQIARNKLLEGTGVEGQ